jgi:DNA-binding MarR family transcriptional regulator
MASPSGPVHPTTNAESAFFDFVDAYDRAYEAAAASRGLSIAQACVLGRLDEPRGMGSLAVELGCDASNITQVVARLESRGLVTRTPDAADRRARVITRTSTGEKVNSEFETAFEFARRAARRLSPTEQDQLTALLRKALGD